MSKDGDPCNIRRLVVSTSWKDPLKDLLFLERDEYDKLELVPWTTRTEDWNLFGLPCSHHRPNERLVLESIERVDRFGATRPRSFYC